MFCPNCGYEQLCDCCKQCKARLPKGHKPWIDEGDNIRCANCGLIAFIGWWEDLAIAVSGMMKKEESKGERKREKKQ